MNEQIRYGPGAVPRRNAEGYQDPTAHQALLTIKKEERVFRPLVYICSPYSGDVESNVARARQYCRFAVAEKNAIPFAPHLLLPQYMEDSDPKQRERGCLKMILRNHKRQPLFVVIRKNN